MKLNYTFCLLLLSSILTISSFQAKGAAGGRVKITFIQNEGDQAKSFLGKLKKGDYANLKGMISPGSPKTTNDINVEDEKGSVSGFVDHITSDKNRNNNTSKLDKQAQKELFGNYSPKNQKELKRIKEQKLKQNKSKANSSEENYQSYKENQQPKPNSQLSKYFKIATAGRLRNGHSFRREPGRISLIIVYKIREGRNCNTYVTTLDGYLNPDSRYNLRYHGTGTRRQYYLEYTGVEK